MIKHYTQSTYETCLACCLFQAVNRFKKLRISKQLELDCINHSLNNSKEDFVIGHLDFIVKKYNVSVKRIVDNKAYFDYLKKTKSLKPIKTEVHRIDLNLINNLLHKKPILYIDAYYLFKVYHYPHFITILDKIGDDYKVFDTWDGKEKKVTKYTLAKSISSLRNHIKLCPQVILLE